MLRIERRELGDPNYRGRAPPPALEIVRDEARAPRSPIWPAAFGIAGAALTIGGAIVDRMAILGTGTALIVAAMLLRRTGSEVQGWLRVERDRVRARCAGEDIDVPRDHIESAGQGGGPGARTLWISVRGEGRRLVLDELTDDEADRAHEALREALATAR